MNVIQSNQAASPRPTRGIGGHVDYLEVPSETRTPITSTVSKVLGIARKHRWVLIACTTGALVLGLVATLLMTPLYTATATLEIQRETQNFTNVEGADPVEQAAIDPEFYQTQYGLLQARSLAERVATDLKLFDDASFFEMFGSSKADDWFAEGKLIADVSTRPERVREAGTILLQNLSIEPERLSRLVDISFTSPSAALSKRVIDAWSAHFIEAALERRFETTSYAREFLEDRLEQLRSRIDQSERQLVAYAAEQGIINLPESAQGPNGSIQAERSLAADDLATLNQELARATADRIQAESRLGSNGGAVAEALNNQGISSMRAARANLAAEYARLMEQFEPGYPAAQALERQIDQLDRSIAAEEQRVRRTIGQTYEAALGREQQLARQVEELKSGLLDVRRRSIQYNVLQREVDTNRELYDALLQRYKEIGVAGGVGVNYISVVDPAKVPLLPSSPSLPLNMAIALLAGLAIGAGVVLLLEQLSDRIDDPADVTQALGAPLLGIVPKMDDDPVSALDDPKDPLTEAYISLQTSLAFSTDHGFPKVLAVTSSRPAEGKSITSYALARSLAHLSRRVLIIDGDMRSPSVHHTLNVAAEPGLSNYLAGEDDLSALVQSTRDKNLFVLSAGPQPPNAATLLSSDRFARMIGDLVRDFDHVVIDAPPVMGLADAPLIASKIEGAVFVVEAHSTDKSVARVAISRLRSANAHLFGVIVTKFDDKRAHYGYGYNYGYGYGYGRSDERLSD